MTAQIIRFPPKATSQQPDDAVIREYLRTIYLNPRRPLIERVRAAIFAPYFGEDVSAVMDAKRKARQQA
jgi:hypothetical protein